MIVVVPGDGSPIRVEQADDLRRFSASAPGRDAAAAGEALAALGAGFRAEAAGHVAVRIDAVRDAVGDRPAPDWDARFDAMVDYARGKGWLTPDGEAILAHLEEETS